MVERKSLASDADNNAQKLQNYLMQCTSRDISAACQAVEAQLQTVGGEHSIYPEDFMGSLGADGVSADYSEMQKDSRWDPDDEEEAIPISSEKLAHSLLSADEVNSKTSVNEGVESALGKGTREGKYRCSVCGSRHLKPSHLKQHMCTHSEDRSFVCPVENCGRQYKRRDHLNRHSLSHRGNLFPCTWAGCDLSFNVHSNLVRHRKLHEKWGSSLRGSKRGDLRLTCPELGCDKAFKYPSLLQTHIDTVHNSSLISQAGCMEPGCGEIFDSLSELRSHTKVAHRYVFCETCGESMTRKSLATHTRKHEGEQVLMRCPHPGCLHSYTKKSNLNVHIRAIHLNLKPFACSQCEMTFAYKAACDKHEQSSRHGRPILAGDFEVEDLKFLKSRGGRKRLRHKCTDDLLPQKSLHCSSEDI